MSGMHKKDKVNITEYLKDMAKPMAPRVRFIDEENITERFISIDEVDHVVPQIKKMHILKNRSSSETSILLRGTGLSKESNLLVHRRSTLDLKDGDNNNSLCENLNEKSADKQYEKENFEERLQDESINTKESEQLNFKKNSNVYSVNQAKTIVSERKKSTSLSTIPKLIGHKVGENHSKPTISADIGSLEASMVTNKDFKSRTIGKISRGFGKLLRRSNSVKISEPDPVYKVAYLGNVLTGWARGESCVDKPLATLWRNYSQSTKPDVVMKLSIANSGLKGFTKEHGLTEYWSHRISFCTSPPQYPKIFCWVYRHEGRKLKHELRCHAVLCAKESISKKITEALQAKLHQALAEFKKDKISRQNARLSLANAVYDNPSMPRRKILLSVGANNYRPPLERSKSAPKLGAIEELCSEEDEEEAVMTENTNSCNTWTKKVSENRKNYEIEELYPSYTLGRRRSVKMRSPRKICSPDKKLQSRVKCDSTRECTTKSVTFCEDIHLLVGESKGNHLEVDALPSVEIYNRENCVDSVDDSLRVTNSLGSDTNEEQNALTDLLHVDKSLEILSHLCSTRQNNFSILDSDDGSVSSGCETASTVTSSDIESNSLTCQFTETCRKDDNVEGCAGEKLSVLERVHSFEKMSATRRSLQIANRYRRQSSGDGCMSPASTESDPVFGEDPFENDSKSSNEVCLEPFGENNCLRRRLTYPPMTSGETAMCIPVYDCKFDKLSDNLTEFDSLESNCDTECNFESEGCHNGDDESACSDESGYSELLENGKESLLGNTVMV